MAEISRRGFLGTAAAAVASALMPCTVALALPEAAAPACSGMGAFMAAKTAEFDLLYEELARNLSLHIWGSQVAPCDGRSLDVG